MASVLSCCCVFLLHHLDGTLLFLAVFLLCQWYLSQRNLRLGLPPGPPSIPILGSIPILYWHNPNILEALRALRRRYGDVFTVMLGSRSVVMLSSYDAAYEALVKRGEVFQGRPQDMFFIKELTKGQGIVSSQGHHWEEQRRFALGIFRKFGLGKSIMEEKLRVELQHFLNWMHESLGKPFDPRTHIQTAAANIITSIMFGKRYHYKDPTFRRHVAIMNKNAELVGQCSPLTVFPVLKHLPGDLFGFHQIKATAVITRGLYKTYIAQHESNPPESSDSRDFLDAYLQEIEKNKSNPESTFTGEQLMKVIADLYGAGIETTTTTLRWAIVYMLHYPEVKRRCQKEIDSVIGHGQLPTMHDKVRMPYTEATIMEIQRMADIIPLGVPHSTMEDVHFRGYFLPKGTTVMVNFYSVHRDPDVWQDPDVFLPERFLDEHGRLEHNKKLIPFSLGKRVCMGESLAKMELFFFFVTMMLYFDFRCADDSPLPDLYGILSMTKIPRPFEVIATARAPLSS